MENSMNNTQDFEFSLQEQLEISEAMEKMFVLTKDEVDTFQIFVRRVNRWYGFVH